MKFIPIILAALVIAGCQQSVEKPNNKPKSSQSPVSPAALVMDVSTPDRALKSYWQSKDAVRRAEYEFVTVTIIPELQKLRGKVGLDPKKVMTSDVLSAHQEFDNSEQRSFQEFSREILDIKQDTESRATAIVKVRNATPIPEGAVISDSDKKRRDEGEKLKYVLEKGAEGWKVAQVYKYDELGGRVDGSKDPWKKVFSAPSGNKSADEYVNEYMN